MSLTGIPSIDSRTWYEVWDRDGCTSRATSLRSAEYGCRSDYGRTLYVYDLEGRIASIWRDGRRADSEAGAA